MPANFFDPVRDGITSGFLPEYERSAVAVLHICARFANLNATIRSAAYIDGHDATVDVMQQLLSMDDELQAWETSQQGKWLYETFTDPTLPPEAVFCQTYHRYSDVWTSRVWSHFRWTRLLANQTLLELVRQNPVSGAAVVSAATQDRCHETILRVAVDVLTSVPTHYKHPRLTYHHLDAIQTHGGAGAGAVGIPHLMFHLQVAACAPGVPRDVWAWAVDLMETAWGELGMLHAKSLAELSRHHRAKLNGFVSGSIVKTEPDLYADCASEAE